MEQLLLEREFVKKIENQEAQYWSDYYLCYKSELQKELKTSVKVIEGAICCALPTTNTLAFNRTIGIGLDYTITANQLQDIIEFYRSVGAKRFMIQVSPAAIPGYNAEIFLRNGFVHHNNWAKLYRLLERMPEFPESEISIEELRNGDIEEFDKVMLKAFEFENGSHLMFSGSYKMPGWKHYIAKLKGKTIAAASLYVCGKFASLAIGGTLPEARGKGAQSLLIAKRLRDAYLAGCEYVVVETAQDLPDKPSQSYRNIVKAGFETAYLRPNYVYNFN